MINMILWKQFDHKTHKNSGSKIVEAPIITHDLKWLQEEKTFLKKKKTTPTFWLTESITLSGLLIGEACITRKLPGDRPAASHRPGPEEPCLNYKLGTHLSVTQRNQCTVGSTEMTHMRYNIWKPQWEGSTDSEKIDTYICMCTMGMTKCNWDVWFSLLAQKKKAD